jgi:hypothetical protein
VCLSAPGDCIIKLCIGVISQGQAVF